MEGLEVAERAAVARKTYAVLGLAAGCGEAAVKKAFKQASLKYHPDKQGGKDAAAAEAAAAKFVEVKEAYETLSDEATRRALDAAVATVDQASRAHTERLSAMDESRRRFRRDLERREAAAAPTTQAESVDALRRANAARAQTYERERSTKARRAAASGVADGRRLDESRAREKMDRLRRSIKVKWKKRPMADDDVVALLRRFGVVEAVEASDAKAALVVFDSDAAATDAAVDESLASVFKDVKLCTHDAFDRVRNAVARRADADRINRSFSTTTTTTPSFDDDVRRADERAKLEAALRREEETGGDGGGGLDQRPSTDAVRKRARLAAFLADVVRGPPPADPEGRALHLAEAAVLERLLASDQRATLAVPVGASPVS